MSIYAVDQHVCYETTKLQAVSLLLPQFWYLYRYYTRGGGSGEDKAYKNNSSVIKSNHYIFKERIGLSKLSRSVLSIGCSLHFLAFVCGERSHRNTYIAFITLLGNTGTHLIKYCESRTYRRSTSEPFVERRTKLEHELGGTRGQDHIINTISKTTSTCQLLGEEEN